jgi:predicted transcriptional regulator
LDYIRASIARDIIRQRKALGLTQAELAALAGVREETLCRLESGKHSPTVRTVEKIDRALKQAAKKEQAGKRPNRATGKSS